MQLPLDLDLGTVLLAIAAALAGAVCVSLMSGHGALPPGPPGLPLLGNTLDLTAPKVHRKLLMWANQYGGMFTLKTLLMGKTNTGVLFTLKCLGTHVFLNDPVLFLPLLGKSGVEKELNKRTGRAGGPMSTPPVDCDMAAASNYMRHGMRDDGQGQLGLARTEVRKVLGRGYGSQGRQESGPESGVWDSGTA
eukprot:gene25-12837_t